MRQLFRPNYGSKLADCSVLQSALRGPLMWNLEGGESRVNYRMKVAACPPGPGGLHPDTHTDESRPEVRQEC